VTRPTPRTKRPLPAVAALFATVYIPRVAIHESWAAVYGMVSPAGVMHTPATRVAAVAFIVVQLALAVTMWRTRRFLFWPRFALALAMVLTCVRGADADHLIFIVPAVGLAVDTGIRWGWRSFVVPVSLLAPLAWLPEHARYALATGAVPMVLGCLLGMGLAVYGRLRDHAIDERARLDIDARASAAHLAGRNAVLMASEATADLIQRAGVLLDLGRVGATPARRVAALKARTAEETRRLGAYLGDVLAAWQRQHNGHADLSRVVHLDVEPSVGTAMVTGGQARQVRDQFDALDLRGTVAVTPAGTDLSSLDRHRRVRVGDAVVDIVRAEGLASWVLSPIPVTAVMVALWMLSPWPAEQTTSVVVPVVFLVFGLVLAYRVHRLVAVGPGLVGRALTETVVLMALYCVALVPFGKIMPGAARAVPFPATGAIELLVVFAALAYPFLAPRRRWLVWPAFALFAVLDALPSFRAFSWRNTIGEIGFLPSIVGLIFDAGGRFEAVGVERRRAVEARAASEVARAHDEGRRAAVLELQASLEALRRDLRDRRAALDDAVAAEAERRLRRAEASLLELA
jgi:hypothetical protein